jgi:hypothetical protein
MFGIAFHRDLDGCGVESVQLKRECDRSTGQRAEHVAPQIIRDRGRKDALMSGNRRDCYPNKAAVRIVQDLAANRTIGCSSSTDARETDEGGKYRAGNRSA